MISSYSDRTCAFLVIDLEQDVRSLAGIVNAAEAVSKHLKVKRFSAGPNVIIVQDLERRLTVHLTP